jgi:hypothetical protein
MPLRPSVVVGDQISESMSTFINKILGTGWSKRLEGLVHIQLKHKMADDSMNNTFQVQFVSLTGRKLNAIDPADFLQHVIDG